MIRRAWRIAYHGKSYIMYIYRDVHTLPCLCLSCGLLLRGRFQWLCFSRCSQVILSIHVILLVLNLCCFAQTKCPWSSIPFFAPCTRKCNTLWRNLSSLLNIIARLFFFNFFKHRRLRKTYALSVRMRPLRSILLFAKESSNFHSLDRRFGRSWSFETLSVAYDLSPTRL